MTEVIHALITWKSKQRKKGELTLCAVPMSGIGPLGLCYYTIIAGSSCITFFFSELFFIWLSLSVINFRFVVFKKCACSFYWGDAFGIS